MQGSVHLSTVAAKAVCLGEALRPSFKEYGKRVVANARALAEALISQGLDVLTGGTDTHLLLVDLRSRDLTGNEAEAMLAAANITCNKNPIPFDRRSPAKWSGLRLGVSAGTTRGFGTEEFSEIGAVIAGLLSRLAPVEEARRRVASLCRRFPIYDLAPTAVSAR